LSLGKVFVCTPQSRITKATVASGDLVICKTELTTEARRHGEKQVEQCVAESIFHQFDQRSLAVRFCLSISAILAILAILAVPALRYNPEP
jgi:hypothetical protein